MEEGETETIPDEAGTMGGVGVAGLGEGYLWPTGMFENAAATAATRAVGVGNMTRRDGAGLVLSAVSTPLVCLSIASRLTGTFYAFSCIGWRLFFPVV